MAGSPHDYDEYGNLKLPAWYGKSNLAMLFVFMLMAAMGTTMRLAKRDYNRTTEGNWILAGALTSQSVQFKVRLNANYGQRFLVSKEPIEEYLEGSPSYLMDAPLESLFTQPHPTQDFVLYGLEPSRKYYYARVAPNYDMLHEGSVQTAPKDNVRSNFTFVATGSAFTGSQNPVFEHMANENPLFFLHLGNMHYGDVNGDLETRMQLIDQVLGSTTQEQLYTRAAFSYMWNDRDYLGENTLGDVPGREAAIESYQFAIPSQQPPGAPLYQAYTIGSVRFIISDLRSEGTKDSIMSDSQREWLKAELSKAGDYDFVIWVTPSTWMGDDDLTQNDWTGRPADRVEISEFISALPSQNVLALSAGTEMFAFDDGSHTAYGDFATSETVLSFPLLMSGPADRLGRIVDARYSEGCSTWLYERNHIYSVIEFKENEETLEPCLHIRTHRVTDVTGAKEILLEKEMCGAIFSPRNKDPASGACKAERFSANVELMATSALALLAANIILGFCVGDGFISGVIMMIMTLVGVIATSATVRYMPSFMYNVDQYEAFVVALILNIQLGLSFVFFLCWAKFHHFTRTRDSKRRQATDPDVHKPNNWVEPDVENSYYAGAKDTGTQDEEDEDEENDQFPETNDALMVPVLLGSAAASPASGNSTRSGRSSRSMRDLPLEKAKSVPSRLTQRPSIHEEAQSIASQKSGSSTTEWSKFSVGSQSLARAKSVPSQLSQQPQQIESAPQKNLYVPPPARSRPAPRQEHPSSLSRRPRQIEPVPEAKIQRRPASQSRSAPRKKRSSSLLSLAALIQQNAKRKGNSSRGTDPEPCQTVSSKMVLSTRGPTGPRDAMSDASFQSTFETEEESMRNVPGVDMSFNDETDDEVGETVDEDVLEASLENETHSVTTSDKTFDEDVISDSRICLDPDDGSSGDEAIVEEEENSVTERHLDPEDGSSVYEAGIESDASVVKSLSREENAITECDQDPHYPTRTETESSMAEFYGYDHSLDDSEESTMHSETSDDSMFESMRNSREPSATLAAAQKNDGMSDSEDDVEDAPDAVVEHDAPMDPTPDDDDQHSKKLEGPRDPEEEDQAVISYHEGDAEGTVDREEPTTVTDDEVSELMEEEILDDAEIPDEENSATIHLASTSDDTSDDGDVKRDTALTTSLGAAAITTGKADHDTDEATISADEETSDVETSFKSEEMEITFIKSDSVEEEDDSTADNHSEESFEEHMRSHLNSFTESSPRRIAVDP